MSSNTYTIFGVEESPYSVKVRSYFRYKQIPYEWKGRQQDPETYSRHARLPLVPLVVTPQDTAMQDSTPIIETLEQEFAASTIYPDDPVSRFISDLLEEFGDEWGNKWMFHYRWAREIDQIGCATRLVLSSSPTSEGAQLNTMIQNLRERMVNRVWFVGSSDQTGPQIEASFQAMLKLLESHLSSRAYIFGARPAFADFGLWGQIYNANRDSTPAQFVRSAPNVQAWIERMLNPTNDGPFEPWSNLESTLVPLLTDQVGSIFLPWSVANSEAIAGSAEEFDVQLGSGTWVQKPQKYHARSLQALRTKYAQVKDEPALRELLQQTGCLEYLE